MYLVERAGVTLRLNSPANFTCSRPPARTQYSREAWLAGGPGLPENGLLSRGEPSQSGEHGITELGKMLKYGYTVEPGLLHNNRQDTFYAVRQVYAV